MSQQINLMERLQLLGIELTSLVSHGNAETITTIEQHIDNGDLIEYICNKYRDFLSIQFDSQYYIKDAEQAFYAFSGYISGNESRKYGIINESDGLLLMIALLFDIIK